MGFYIEPLAASNAVCEACSYALCIAFWGERLLSCFLSRLNQGLSLLYYIVLYGIPTYYLHLGGGGGAKVGLERSTTT